MLRQICHTIAHCHTHLVWHDSHQGRQMQHEDEGICFVLRVGCVSCLVGRRSSLHRQLSLPHWSPSGYGLRGGRGSFQTTREMPLLLSAGPGGIPRNPHNLLRQSSNSLVRSRVSSRFLVQTAAMSVSRFSAERGTAISSTVRVPK
jgi:hypothetical protein